MYYLPILVNNRKYVILTLKNDDGSINESDFVIDVNKPNVELIRLIQGSRATSENGSNDDVKDVVFSVDSCNSDGGDEIETICLSLKKSAEKTNNETANKDTGCVNISNQSIVLNKVDKDYKELHIKIELNGCKSDLYFHLINTTKAGSFYEVALDFGSESSQAGYVVDGVFKSINLIENAKYISSVKNDVFAKVQNDDFAKVQNDEFLQHDEDSPNLFKTIFYVKKEYNRPLFLSRKDREEGLKENFYLLPNIKIALLDESFRNEEEKNVLVVYRKVISDFIETIVKEFTGKNEAINKHIGLHLKLLVPNVMGIKTIKKLIRNIYDKLLSDENLGEYVHIEISPISESDASFAGYVEENEVKEQRTFLTIDAGKGTMDYSISRVDQDGEIESYYQDGFIGAGNAITYALFDHICAIIVGSTDVKARRELMKRILMGGISDQKGLRELHEALETIKRSYGDSDEESNSLDAIRKRCEALHKQVGEGLVELSAGGLANKLNSLGIGSFGDEFSIIIKMCYDICNKLLLSLDQKISICSDSKWKFWKGRGNHTTLHVDKVILTGRAFKFPILKETFNSMFKEKWGDNIPIVSLDKGPRDNHKDLCLKGALSLNLSINLNCGLPSKPQIYTNLNLGNTSWNFKTQNEFEIDEDFINTGKIIEDKSVVFYNGFEWTVPGFSNNKSISGELYFTGEKPILRHKDSIDILKPKSKNQENSMVFESKFPLYNKKIDAEKIPLFNLT